MIWLLKWRQPVSVMLLVSLIWSSGLLSVPPSGREWLAGWWLGNVQGSGYNHCQSEWVKRRVRIPWWLMQSWA